MAAEPENLLWQSVIFQAAVDATADPDCKNDTERHARRDARDWLGGGGRDFREVCSLAGFDPDFIRKAFMDGRIDREILKAAGESVKRGRK